MHLLLTLLVCACLSAADQPLLKPDALAAARLVGAAAKTSTARFDPASGVLTLAISDSAADPWGLQVLLPVEAAIAAGDPLRLSLRVRCSAPPAAGEPALAVFVQRGEKPYAKSISRRIAATAAWQDIVVDGRACEDLPAGKAQVGFFLGISQGVYEIAGLSLSRPPR